jgi:hypothetical protein
MDEIIQNKDDIEVITRRIVKNMTKEQVRNMNFRINEMISEVHRVSKKRKYNRT